MNKSEIKFRKLYFKRIVNRGEKNQSVIAFWTFMLLNRQQ